MQQVKWIFLFMNLLDYKVTVMLQDQSFTEVG